MKATIAHRLSSFVRTRLFVVVTVVAVVVVSGSVVMLNARYERQQILQEQAVAYIKQMQNQVKQQSELEAEKQAAKKAEQNNNSFTAQATPKQTGVKYCTTPDPQCKIYSDAPPAPNPASFEIIITKAGQVPAGTVISYNATKGEKAYYGGDLVLSQSTVTVSKSNIASVLSNVTVSSPDGQTIGMPSKQWNDYSSNVNIGMSSSLYKNSGNSFEMLVEPAANTPPGAYQLHIFASRLQQTADAWYYHGFMTVIVTE